jgi:two-component system response regulator NreC
MAERLLLADDHMIVRDGLKILLMHEGFEIAAEVSNGREAVESARKFHPDVAVLDFAMPLLNGIDAAREIQTVSPRTKSIILTMYKEDQYALEALRAGVKGYVLKTQAGAELVQAIRATLRGETYISPEVAERAADAMLANRAVDLDPLTQRERQVLQLIGEGMTNKEISRQLGMSVKTVESHRANVMKKLNIHETAGLVRHAIKIGLIQP